ncbi:hypothetical protein Sste5346_002025 [Sporothrix stenoceras]|uniref:Xylanolytic transcriptional activator regulatory domain-containing protein n=1 Tax=Sporothrix stenoceras TaxID=5173 RepID=A0ABR3ZN88_9PEZI
MSDGTGDDPDLGSTTPTRTTATPANTPANDCTSCTNLLYISKRDNTDSHSRETLLARVDHFFQHAYPLPSYSFLHPATTRSKCAVGQLDPALVLAICALTCLHPQRGHDNGCSCSCQGASLVREVETLIWQQLEYPTTARLQALLLSINHRMETGQFQRAFMLVSLAARFVAALGLHCESEGGDKNEGVTSVHHEVRRRIVWSLKLTERYFSHGLSAFELCPYESIDLQLPCPEEEFQGGGSGGDVRAGDGGDGGAYNICVSLEALRRDIMKMNRAVSRCDKDRDRHKYLDTEAPVTNLVAQIRHVDWRLQRLGERFPLPQSTAVSHADLARLAQTPWIARHVQMHLSWHQCYCDMHRLLLPGFHEAAPLSILSTIDNDHLAWAETQCVHHAVAILDLLACLNQVSTVPHLLEFDTAICAYQAALVVLFVARFGRTPQLQRPTREFATSRAELCLAALNRFFPASALVKPIREELQRAMHAFGQAGQAGQPGMSVLAVVDPMEPSPATSLESGTNTTTPIQQQQQHQDKSPGARQIREKLAIHSLLRRADFSGGDDGDDGDDGGVDTVETVPEDVGITVDAVCAVDAVVAAVESGLPAETATTSQHSPPRPPPFLTDGTDFLQSDGLLQQAQAQAPVDAPVEAPAFTFTEAYPLLENRFDGELHMLDFPLFPWYGLVEQGWSGSDGGF